MTMGGRDKEEQCQSCDAPGEKEIIKKRKDREREKQKITNQSTENGCVVRGREMLRVNNDMLRTLQRSEKKRKKRERKDGKKKSSVS